MNSPSETSVADVAAAAIHLEFNAEISKKTESLERALWQTQTRLQQVLEENAGLARRVQELVQKSEIEKSLTSPPPPPNQLCMDRDESLSIWTEHCARLLTWYKAHSEPTQHWAEFGDTRASGVAVLVETRKDPRAEFVLRSAAHFLTDPEDVAKSWALVIYCAKSNEAFMKKIVKTWPRVEVRVMPFASMDVKLYSKFLTTLDFWKFLKPHAHALIFQTDGLFMSRVNRVDTPQYFDWAYFGAPWNSTCFVCHSPVLADVKCCGRKHDDAFVHAQAPNLVGNGGFSLRNINAMVFALMHFVFEPNAAEKRPEFASKAQVLKGILNEDVFFVHALKLLKDGIEEAQVRKAAALKKALVVDAAELAEAKADASLESSDAAELAESKADASVESSDAAKAESAESAKELEVPWLMQVGPRSLALSFSIEQCVPPRSKADTGAWACMMHNAVSYLPSRVLQKILADYSTFALET